MRTLKSLPQSGRDIRSVIGGLLVQDSDNSDMPELEHNVVTARPPTKAEIEAMEFGWKVVKHVKSNAIVYAGTDRTLGIGAGQMSRVDSSRIAVWKAQEAGLSLKGSVVCSDAFFRFPMDSSRRLKLEPRLQSSRVDPCVTQRSFKPRTKRRVDGLHWHAAFPPLTELWKIRQDSHLVRWLL